MKEFFKKAFGDMKESAKKQHEVDKANFNAVNFEENRGKNTFAKAKADAKASWEAAKMSPKERQEEIKEEQQKQIKEANARKEAAEKRLEDLRK